MENKLKLEVGEIVLVPFFIVKVSETKRRRTLFLSRRWCDRYFLHIPETEENQLLKEIKS
jgi:hypothetical protein